MDIEQMKRRKIELGYTNERISFLSGVPLGTVQKIFSGVTAAPRYETLKALEKVLIEKETIFVKEAAVSYHSKQQGEYTLEDYLAQPDEQRAELIDGAFYYMASPSLVHQLITGQIFAQLNTYIRTKKGTCIPCMAPMDVQLDCDDKTVVEPDLMVVCDRDKALQARIYGAPDFIVEVISQSTKRKDMFIKSEKYMNAGVREYWLVDPDKKKVIVYDFEYDDYPMLYGFDASIPVKIFRGECSIDFREIYDYIKFMYER